MIIKEKYKQIINEKRRVQIRLLINKITSLFYVGNKFSCNCCKKSFRKFISKGNGLISRENAECPYCTALERSRILLFYIENETDLLTENRCLLHFSPEWSLYPIFKKTKTLKYISADINPNLADEQIDIMSIPYENNYFDYIICSHVLGHVTDEKKGINEMVRVLKSDGIALIMTIINPNLEETFETEDADTAEKKLKYYSERDLLRLHGNDFDKRLLNGGFKSVEKIDYRIKLGEDICTKYSLGNGNREVIFKCTKY